METIYKEKSYNGYCNECPFFVEKDRFNEMNNKQTYEWHCRHESVDGANKRGKLIKESAKSAFEKVKVENVTRDRIKGKIIEITTECAGECEKPEWCPMSIS